MRRTVAAMTPIRIALLALLGGKAGGRKADDDGVVAGQHEIDRDDLQQGAEAGGRENFHEWQAL